MLIPFPSQNVQRFVTYRFELAGCMGRHIDRRQQLYDNVSVENRSSSDAGDRIENFVC